MSGSCSGWGGGHVDGQDEERGDRINGFWYVK